MSYCAFSENYLEKRRNVKSLLKRINNDLVSISGMNDGLKIRVKTGTNTLTSIFDNLNAPCLCVCTTENISDKPGGKYGNVLILKISSNRQTALCLTNDGLCYINSYNTSTSALTGWKQL